MTKKLKEMIFKIAGDKAKDIDGDIIDIFDKKYYVNYINDEVMEVKSNE
jgi:hypothetical protein